VTRVDLRHVDLSKGLPSLDEDDGSTHRWYLWWKSRPLGLLRIEPWQLPMSRARLVRLVAAAVGPAVGDLLHPETIFAARLPFDLAVPAGPPPPLAALIDLDALARLDVLVSGPVPAPVGVRTAAVVVCTRNRPEKLRDCLRSIAALRHPPDELVVVDNGADDSATRRVAEEFEAVCVAEPQPGLSRARDAGIAATTSDVIAFTDDDVLVNTEWLQRLLSGFTEPEVMAVTGLVLPAVLATPAELAFEDDMGGFGQGFRVRDFGHEWALRQRRRTPHVWKVGAGANAAFRREAFDRVGGFDPRLGAGAAGCSEDSEMWYRLLTGGWRCRYEPWAVVYHRHRQTLPELQDQSVAYLRGHVASLAVQWARTRQLGEPRRAFASLPNHFLRRALARNFFGGDSIPTLGAQVTGYLQGLAVAVTLVRRVELPLRPHDAPGEGPVVKASLADFQATNPFPHPRTLGSFYGEKMRAIHHISPHRGVRRVLEVGGGQSGLAAALYPSAEVLTVDLERSFGGRHDLYGSKGRTFACADATRLPIADGTVDVVTLFDVAEHIPDDAAAFGEALRVLRPGGHLLVTTPSELWRFPYYGVYRRFTPTDEDVMAEWGHVRRGYRIVELDRLVGRAHDDMATFITPVTVLAHDVAFSRLRPRVKRAVGLALAPLVVPAARWHAPAGAGSEVALRWTVK